MDVSPQELRRQARRLLIQSADPVPGPDAGQLGLLHERLNSPGIDISAEIDEVSARLDREETPGMGAVFAYDARRVLRYAGRHTAWREVAPGVGRLHLRYFAYTIYFAAGESPPRPLAVLPDARSPYWWQDLPSRGESVPVTDSEWD